MISYFALMAAAVTAEPLFTSGTYGQNYSLASTRLRRDLLSAYDKIAPPLSDRSGLGVDFSSAGTDVRLNVRFFKVQGVEPNKGTMRIKVWVKEKWVDQRLAWNPAEYDNVEYIFFWGDTRPTSFNSEIWLPDVSPYNSYVSMQDTLDPGPIRVSSDGAVYFSRSGTLEYARAGCFTPSHSAGFKHSVLSSRTEGRPHPVPIPLLQCHVQVQRFVELPLRYTALPN